MDTPVSDTRIFVFGSNEAGRHGKGAALSAMREHGAVYGVGEGPSGNSYGIPTKDGRLRTLPLDVIDGYVAHFIMYAMAHPELDFQVTRIGCGLAGYTDQQIAPMFALAPDNCELPEGWREICESFIASESRSTSTLVAQQNGGIRILTSPLRRRLSEWLHGRKR